MQVVYLPSVSIKVRIICNRVLFVVTPTHSSIWIRLPSRQDRAARSRPSGTSLAHDHCAIMYTILVDLQRKIHTRRRIWMRDTVLTWLTRTTKRRTSRSMSPADGDHKLQGYIAPWLLAVLCNVTLVIITSSYTSTLVVSMCNFVPEGQQNVDSAVVT
jgi:hypothetical protein